jgi:hypothetical protein
MAAAVPDVKNLHQLQPVVNPIGNVNAHAGKHAQDFDVVDKAVAEAFGCR